MIEVVDFFLNNTKVKPINATSLLIVIIISTFLIVFELTKYYKKNSKIEDKITSIINISYICYFAFPLLFSFILKPILVIVPLIIIYTITNKERKESIELIINIYDDEKTYTLDNWLIKTKKMQTTVIIISAILSIIVSIIS